MSTVLIISLAAGVILVIGGGLMMYMANLVKSAYEIKVQINSDVEERLTKMGEDLDKKSRWIKRDLIEEIEKIKLGLQGEAQRKFEEMAAPFQQRIEQLETLIKAERAEWVKAVETDRATIAALEGKLKGANLKAKKPDDKPPEVAAALEQAAAALEAKPAGEAKEPATAPAPARPAQGPTPVGDFLSEFGPSR